MNAYIEKVDQYLAKSGAVQDKVKLVSDDFYPLSLKLKIINFKYDRQFFSHDFSDGYSKFNWF